MRTIEEIKRNKAKIGTAYCIVTELVNDFEQDFGTTKDLDIKTVHIHLLQAKGQLIIAYDLLAKRLQKEQKRQVKNEKK